MEAKGAITSYAIVLTSPFIISQRVEWQQGGSLTNGKFLHIPEFSSYGS